jgi:hypothetical protein
MAGSLFFVLVRSARGRLAQMVRRLKEPRYLFGFIIGGSWILFWASRVIASGGLDASNVQVGLPAEALEAIAGPLGFALQLVLCTLIAIALLLWWAVPLGRSSMEFTEPELHLLLPAPVPRRSLIQYGVLKSQPGILVGVTITSFFMAPKTLPSIFSTALTLWLMFTIWDLHAKVRGLWYASLDEMPAAQRWRKQGLLWAVVFVGIIGIAWQAFWLFIEIQASQLLALQDYSDLAETLPPIAEAMAATASESTLAWILTPLLLLTKPVFLALSGQPGLPWVAALALPVALAAAHNEWVVRSQSRFEERELARARKRSQTTASAVGFWRRATRIRRWQAFVLAPHGPREVAVVWKNVMQVHRVPLGLLFALPALVLGLFFTLTSTGLLPTWTIQIVQMSGLGIMLITPLVAARSHRCDFRSDLLRLEMMRTFPITGARMFSAQMAAPVLLVLLQLVLAMTVVIAVDLVVEAGFFAGSFQVDGEAVRPQDLKERLAGAIGVARLALTPLFLLTYLPLAVTLTFLTAALENVAALLFPGWVQLGPNKKQAASKFGQNMLVILALSIVMFAALLPGVLTVAAIVGVQTLLWDSAVSPWQVPLLSLAGSVPVMAVVVALVALGGRLWDRLDPSAELLAGRS